MSKQCDTSLSESFPATGPCISESYPALGPRIHHMKPQLLYCQDDQLTLTPEKEKENRHRKKFSKNTKTVKRKVTFDENMVAGTSTQVTSNTNVDHLSQPTMNSTNSIQHAIIKTRDRKFHMSEQILKEISNNVPHEEITSVLNYRPGQQKYKEKLTSITLQPEVEIKKKSLYQEKVKEERLKPRVDDLKVGELIEEKCFMNHEELLKVCMDEVNDVEREEDEQIEIDDCEFLLDMYDANHVLFGDQVDAW